MSIFEELPKKVKCPHCGGMECFIEDADGVESHLCMNCGFTTTSLNIDGSMQMIDWIDTLPDLIKDLIWVDPQTKLVWLPSVINVPETGMIFPDVSEEEKWCWRAAKVVDIDKKEQSKYPIPGKEGEFYKTRVDFTNSKLYSKESFQEACKYIGLIKLNE